MVVTGRELVADQPGNDAGMSLWMADQIRQANRILVVASAAYRAHAEGSQWPAAGTPQSSHRDDQASQAT